MKKLLLASAALLALTVTANADIIANLGVNPTSGAGAFSNTNPGTLNTGSGAFIDAYEFELTGGLTFFTLASVTNVFASADQKITDFTGAVLNEGADGNIGGGDDFFVIGPVSATLGCGIGSNNCQGFAGSAILGAGEYYLLLTGDAAINAGYGGNLSTTPLAVPGPTVGSFNIASIVGLFK